MQSTAFTLDIPFLRPMHPTDLPAILAVQRQCYVPEMNEDESTWRGRLAAAADFTWVAEIGGEVGAYLATYPSHLDKVTPLGGEFVVTGAADCLYVHDLAVAPAASGSGLGARLVEHALQAARRQDLAQAALVCVQDAFAFWQRCGFAERRPLAPAATAALATYPPPARYMWRSID
ncbi:MAG: histone acetyltransferase [Betaproteobacteria bacterium HGW-Betaproteobacteria-7]|jgi:GNAT superfamily N-acetyltransferase|nr:MAG: histone acetyltransferase [Betaproteobacteria bacterium HGW-Betaproteobacteria-7]